MGESAEWDDGTLKVTGVVRGGRLSANRLVHLPNFGDYQVTQVRAYPFLFDRRASTNDPCVVDRVRACNAIESPQGRSDGGRTSGSLGTGTLHG